MKKRGFTLLEMLLVLAILGVVIGVVAASLSAGIRVWEAARDFNRGETQRLLAMEMLRKDLQNTFPYYRVPFRAERTRLEFPGIVRDEKGQPRIGRIVYGLSGGSGGFSRRVTMPGADARNEETLVSNIHRLEIRCFVLKQKRGKRNERFWQPVSGVLTGLPARVDILLEPSDPTENGAWEQTFLLPAGGGAAR